MDPASNLATSRLPLVDVQLADRTIVCSHNHDGIAPISARVASKPEDRAFFEGHGFLDRSRYKKADRNEQGCDSQHK
jgi:hypothetical protein